LGQKLQKQKQGQKQGRKHGQKHGQKLQKQGQLTHSAHKKQRQMPTPPVRSREGPQWVGGVRTSRRATVNGFESGANGFESGTNGFVRGVAKGHGKRGGAKRAGGTRKLQMLLTPEQEALAAAEAKQQEAKRLQEARLVARLQRGSEVSGSTLGSSVGSSVGRGSARAEATRPNLMEAIGQDLRQHMEVRCCAEGEVVYGRNRLHRTLRSTLTRVFALSNGQ
jgi:hypothetical protein